VAIIETMSKLNKGFIHSLLPLQLGMAICYQYESAYFPAPNADNQLLCNNTITRFSSRSSNFCNFTPRIHQKRSQKVKNYKIFLGGMPPDPSIKRATRALIAYWNPPFKNSRSATEVLLATTRLQGGRTRFEWHVI